MDNEISLSIVVPSKNEESNIARCLDSISKHPSSFKNAEIILVDCQSNDKTIEIANKYPIKILQLRPDWTHTPAAARYIGSIFASGEFVFFIDADMILEPDFLERAIDILNQDKNIAAVGGIGKEVYLKDGKEIGVRLNLYHTKNLLTKVNFLGGSALYRKKALMEVEGFNPYLRASEENELAQRLRGKNYSLISIPFPMVTHYTADINEWREFKRKRKMNLFLGIGEAMRISHSVRYLLETLFYYKEFALFLLFVLCELVILIAILSLNKINSPYLFALPIFVFYIYLLFKKGSFKLALLSLIKWFIICADIIFGLMRHPRDPKAYPRNPYILKGNFDV